MSRERIEAMGLIAAVLGASVMVLGIALFSVAIAVIFAGGVMLGIGCGMAYLANGGDA